MFSDFLKRLFGKRVANANTNTNTKEKEATTTPMYDSSGYERFVNEQMGTNIRYHPFYVKDNIFISSNDLEMSVPGEFDSYSEELVDFARRCESSFSYIAASHVSEKITGPTLKAFYEALKREKLYIQPPFDKENKKLYVKTTEDLLERIMFIKYQKVNDRLCEGGYRKKNML